jgi:DDE superfamily endonuclease
VVHVVLDNYATHKHPKLLRWLSRHPRFVFHFTPTSCSWLNVETVFSALSRLRLRRGVFRSIVDLQAAINRYIEDHNAAPQTLLLGRRSRPHPRQGHPRASSVSVAPLASPKDPS